jgi:hypothetical protein
MAKSRFKRTFNPGKVSRAQKKAIARRMVQVVAPALREASKQETPVDTGLLRASRSVRVIQERHRIRVVVRWSMFYAGYVADYQDRKGGSNYVQRSLYRVLPVARMAVKDALGGR